MGELSLSFRGRIGRIGVLRLVVLVVALTLGTIALASTEAQAQVTGDCSADQDALDALLAVAPNFQIICTDGRATELNFYGSIAVGVIPPEIGGFPSLQKLAIGDIAASALPPEIGNLTELTYLSFYENEISELPPEIGKLTKLETLDASENPLTELPAAFANLTNLRELNLSYSEYSAFPPEVTQLKKLTSLGLFGNRITSVPPAIGNLTNLAELDIGDNEIKALPAAIGKLTKLTRLDVGDNNLTALPKQFANLTKLKSLYLTGNKLGSIPPAVWGFTNLTALDLTGTGLGAIPPGIGNLTKLTYLSLGGFRGSPEVTSLPPEIGNLTNLTYANINYTLLTELPDAFDKLTKLDRLNIASGNITTLPPSIGGLKNLDWLDAYNNKLTSLPPEIANLTKLRILNVSDNELRTLPPEIGRMSRVSNFDIGGNKLESLPVQARQLIDGRFGTPFDTSLYTSGLTFPYVAIGACATGSPQLIAAAGPGASTPETQPITVDGVTYELSPARSELSTTQLKNAGTGPTFSVDFAGKTQTVQCQDTSPRPDDVLGSEVFIARSCQARNGRIDFNIVNTQSTARYRVEVSGLKARERSIQGNKSWRVPFTGRPDGSYRATVTKTVLSDNTTQTLTKTFSVDCDKKTPTQLSEEFQVIPYCVAGKGAVRYQFVNPTKTKRTYVVKMKGVRDLRVTARGFGAASNRVARLSDGRITAKIEYADRPGVTVHRKTVKIACGNS